MESFKEEKISSKKNLTQPGIQPGLNERGWALFEGSSNSISKLTIPLNAMAAIFTTDLSSTVNVNFIPAPLEMGAHQFLLLANPREDWGLKLSPNSNILFIDLKALHKFLGVQMVNEGAREESKFKMPTSTMDLNGAMRMTVFQLFSKQKIGPGGVLFREAKIMEFLALLLEDLQGNQKDFSSCPFLENKEDHKKIVEAKKILNNEFRNPNKISDLARRVGTNEYKLKTGFRFLYGYSIHNYLVEQRMENAKRLLSNPGQSVSEVAEAVGYSNSSHFIEAFKKRFGLTPKKLNL